jgi:hypothetical protein
MASSTGDFVAGRIEATIFANDQGETQVRFDAPGVPMGPIADAMEAEGLSDVSFFGLKECEEGQWGTWVGPTTYVGFTFETTYQTASGLTVTGGGTQLYAWCGWPDTCLTADGVDAPWETTP